MMIIHSLSYFMADTVLSILPCHTKEQGGDHLHFTDEKTGFKRLRDLLEVT